MVVGSSYQSDVVDNGPTGIQTVLNPFLENWVNTVWAEAAINVGIETGPEDFQPIWSNEIIMYYYNQDKHLDINQDVLVDILLVQEQQLKRIREIILESGVYLMILKNMYF